MKTFFKGLLVGGCALGGYYMWPGHPQLGAALWACYGAWVLG